MKSIATVLIVLTAYHGNAACNDNLISYADILIKHGYYEQGIELYIEILKTDCVTGKQGSAIRKKIEATLLNGNFSFADSMKMVTINRSIKNKNYADALAQASQLLDAKSSKYKIIASTLSDTLASIVHRSKFTSDSIQFLIGNSYLDDDNYDKAIAYYEKVELAANKKTAQQKIQNALNQKGVIMDVMNDAKGFAKYVIEVLAAGAIIAALYWALGKAFRAVNKNKIEIVENSDGFDSYKNRFKFLFLVRNYEFYRTLGQGEMLPVLYSPAPTDLESSKVELHNDVQVKEFFTAIEGLQYTAILKWLVLSLNRSRYSLQYSFKMANDQGGQSQIAFNAILFMGNKMLATVSRQFPEHQILREEQALAQELVAVVFQSVYEQNP